MENSPDMILLDASDIEGIDRDVMIAKVREELVETKEIMEENLEKAVQRGE